ncbi:MAG: hypothetical protein IPG93_06235 [Burkholderiales bacterium]|nr:hypothetical protein [Burkholderiales bacterium]
MAAAAYLIEIDGRVSWSRHADTPLPPASLTKPMMALLVDTALVHQHTRLAAQTLTDESADTATPIAPLLALVWQLCRHQPVRVVALLHQPVATRDGPGRCGHAVAESPRRYKSSCARPRHAGAASTCADSGDRADSSGDATDAARALEHRSGTATRQHVDQHLGTTGTGARADDRRRGLGLFMAIGIGIGIGIEVGLARQRWRNWPELVTVAKLIVFAALTTLRNLDYRSEVLLWQQTTAVSPHKARAFNNLGHAYSAAGCGVLAEAAYRHAQALNPNYTLARDNLASLIERGMAASAPGC